MIDVAQSRPQADHYYSFLTAIMRTALWRAAKKNGLAWSQITDALKERKR